MSESPFNAAFAEARIESGMTVKDLARHTGFTPGFIQYYEDCAKNPTVTTMWRYARALGLTVTITGNGLTMETKEGALLLKDWRPRDDV